jgi:hypothetical protein
VSLCGHAQDYTGNYVWHCHILEHEDNDMMRPLVVLPRRTPTPDRTDPRGAFQSPIPVNHSFKACGPLVSWIFAQKKNNKIQK